MAVHRQFTTRLPGAAVVLVVLMYLQPLVDGARKKGSNESLTGSGCGGYKLCCPGRNITCSATGQRADDKDPAATCYCDEACLALGDCCLDYRAVCRCKFEVLTTVLIIYI